METTDVKLKVWFGGYGDMRWTGHYQMDRPGEGGPGHTYPTAYRIVVNPSKWHGELLEDIFVERGPKGKGWVVRVTNLQLMDQLGFETANCRTKSDAQCLVEKIVRERQ